MLTKHYKLEKKTIQKVNNLGHNKLVIQRFIGFKNMNDVGIWKINEPCWNCDLRNYSVIFWNQDMNCTGDLQFESLARAEYNKNHILKKNFKIDFDETKVMI